MARNCSYGFATRSPRASVISRTSDGSGCGRHVSRVAAGRWQRGVPEVVPEVEVRVVDPHGAAQVEGHEAHLLAVARDERELAGDEVGEVAVVRCRPFEDPDRA